jgi:hypothetical protein
MIFEKGDRNVSGRWSYLHTDRIPAVKIYFRAPVFVTFLEGLIGPGGFVWAGNSSPWGWE